MKVKIVVVLFRRAKFAYSGYVLVNGVKYNIAGECGYQKVNGGVIAMLAQANIGGFKMPFAKDLHWVKRDGDR